MGGGSLDLLKGTLDILILKTLSGGAMHGYAISRTIREATEEALSVEEGALYPALRRLEQKGLLSAHWGVTETGRDAKLYELTSEGRRELDSGTRTWHRYVAAMSRVLGSPVRG